jgi:hypothetical protein
MTVNGMTQLTSATIPELDGMVPGTRRQQLIAG